MGTVAQYPSPTNVYIPTNSTNAQLTANLVINYSRNPSKFPLNQYIKLIPVKQRIGYYIRLSVGQGWRLTQPFVNQYLWNPGQDRPRGDANKQGLLNVQYTTERYSFTTNYDYIENDQAAYQLEASTMAMLAQEAMTARTYQVLTNATTTGNWPSTNTNNATSLVGGTWTSASTADPLIMKSIQKMAIQITLNTGAVVQLPDMSIIINPNLASSAASSDEWRSYLRDQVGSPQFLQGKEPTPATLYNLSKDMYGVKLILENTVYNTSNYTPADNTSGSIFIMPDADVLMVARPGDLTGSEGSTDFATLGIFSYEEMTTETDAESWNRKLKFAVSEDFQAQIITPLAGYLLTGAI